MKATDPVSVEELRELLDLDPATGLLTWMPRPRHLFKNQSLCDHWNERWAGQPALNYVGDHGYRFGSISNRSVRTHRVVWALHHGAWPTRLLDHINGDKADNRPDNLREATLSENQRNATMRRKNKSGVNGVSRFRNKWKAEIRLFDRSIYLGLFDTIEEAAAARKAAEAEHGFHPNHGRPHTSPGPGNEQQEGNAHD